MASRPTALIVDDDPAVLGLLARYLERDGVHVLKASTGDAAVSLAETTEELDLLVSDYDLPGRTGADVIAHVCALHPNVRPVLISGSPRAEAVDQDHVFLAKPFTLAQLASVVANGFAPDRSPTRPLPGGF